MRTAEALVANHGQSGAERAYHEAVEAARNPDVRSEELGHLDLVAHIARTRFLELERISPEERRFIYMRWLCRKGQIITGAL